jgi:hypothetical protein
MATPAPSKSPFQTIVSPPDGIALSPRLSSLSESMAEAGSCKVALHRFPRAVIYFALCESRVGYALMAKGIVQVCGFTKEERHEKSRHT